MAAEKTKSQGPTIRITQKLLESLAGRSVEDQPIRKAANHRANQSTPPRGQLESRQQEAGVSQVVQSVQRADLVDTINYGNLLLKHEERELQQVEAFAEDLLKRNESRAQRTEALCEKEKAACHLCYKENEKDLSKCADVVKEYSTCAQSAHKVYVQRDK